MSTPVFLVMPQWQGSPSSRAMQLADGADALREDLPRTATHEVAVPLEAGDAMGTPVARLSSLLGARDAARTALAAAAGPAVIVGGDCASSLAGLEAATEAAEAREHGGLAVLWFDAHPDLHHPSTSPSGAASRMTLRHACGGGSPDLDARTPLDTSRLTFVGLRAADPDEALEMTRLDAHTLSPQHEEQPDDFAGRMSEHLRELGADQVYLHIDLDVLDPAEFAALHEPVPFGLSVAQLTSAIRAAVATLPLAGAAICGFAPTSAELAADDLPTVLRILGALTSGSHS